MPNQAVYTFQVDTSVWEPGEVQARVSRIGWRTNVTPLLSGIVTFPCDEDTPGNGEDEVSNHTTTVTGTVTDQDGQPIAGATLSHNGIWSDGVPSSTTTDTNGAFSLSGQMNGYYPWGVLVTAEGCTAFNFASYGSDGNTSVRDVGAIQLTCEPTAPVDGAAHSFNLVAAQRMCADQSFNATWTGSNIASLEFALNNSSDSWASGWLVADPTTGTFTAAVDHHGYDRAAARVTFADGTTQQVEMNTNECAEQLAPVPVDPVVPAPAPAESVVPVPAPVNPVASGSGSNSQASSGSGTSSGTGTTAAVTSMPSTGVGHTNTDALMHAAAATILLALVAVVSRFSILRKH